ncbi:MAG TPA: hypothetical protein VFL65_07640 [Jatrophihabitans sp.]|nr:hypothetical protein [Jatrophihabitans sp.]
MGRHSAPDDGHDVATIAAPPRRGTAAARARHARPDAEDVETTATIPPVTEAPHSPAAETEPLPAEPAPAATEPLPVEGAATEPAPALPARRGWVGRGNQATAADLALLRTRSDVRARCIAAVVVPFVIYSAVMYLIGSLHVYLIWIWIPLVTAGIFAGSILDAAHRKYPPGG